MASFATEVQYVRELLEARQDTKVSSATPFERALEAVAPGKWYRVDPRHERRLLQLFVKTLLHRHKDDVVYAYRETPDAEPTAIIDYSMLRMDVLYRQHGKRYSLRYDTNATILAAKNATKAGQLGDALVSQ
jgi:hypothetical protein